jgi:PAS domain S-box-containing protein
MASKYHFENADHFRSMVYNIDGYLYTVIYVDGAAAASYHSPRCFDVTGYAPEEYSANPRLWIEMVHPEDRDSIFTLFDSRLHRSDQTYIEHRIIRKDGAVRWIANRFTEQFDAEGRITRRDGFISDITVRKNLELQIIRNEKLLAIGEMSAMISHEFRNSLTSMKLILQLQKESLRLSRKEKQSLDVALNSIYHMEDVLRALLTFAQPVKPEFAPTNITAVIEECLSLMRIQAQKKVVRLNNRATGTLPPIYANEGLLKETIINLLLNAIQAFDSAPVKLRRGILITAEVLHLEERMVDTGLNVTSEYFKTGETASPSEDVVIEKGSTCIFIKIADNGGGINPEYLSHIFEPFFTSKERGSGLGLAIAKRTINAHNGVIRVKSKYKKGTAISIYLPVR